LTKSSTNVPALPGWIRFSRLRVWTALTLVRLYGADLDTAYLQNVLTDEPVLLEGVSSIVLAQGHEPVSALADAVAERSRSGAGPEVHLVGDCLSPRTVEEAVLEGLQVGCAL